MDEKLLLEAVVIPVAEVDRAKDFYGGEYDENWPDWYAAHMVAEATGTELPE